MCKTHNKWYKQIWILCFLNYCARGHNASIEEPILSPKLEIFTDQYHCQRSWQTHEDARKLKQNLKELVNIRNISYIKYRLFHADCKENFDDDHKHCPFLYRSPFFLRWSFTSVLTCQYINNSSLEAVTFLRLYISFEAIKTKFMSRHEPISRTVSIFGEDESGQENKYVKFLAASLQQPDVVKFASTKNMRDFYNINVTNTAIVKIALELVTWHNLTFLSPNESNKFDLEALIPEIYPRLFSNMEKASTLGLRKKIYYETSMDVSVPRLDLNFIYCDVPQQEKVNRWDFSRLLIPFQYSVWCATVMAVGVITLFIFWEMSMSFERRPQFSVLKNIMWSLISGLISYPVYFSLRIELKYSFMFSMWLFATLILTNFYNAIFTSLIIEPIRDKTLNSFKDLVVNNYTLIFSNTSLNSFETAMTIVDLQEKKITSSNNIDYWSNADLLKVLLTDSPKDQIFSLQQFTEKLAFGERVAAFGPWPSTFSNYQRAMRLIETKRNLDDSDDIKIICRFGQNMFPAFTILWRFYPPNVDWLYETYLIFVENGIDDLWIREFYGLTFANRVQDRARVKSVTQMEIDRDLNGPEALSLFESHFITVILLGMVLWVTSGMVFALEILIFRFFKHYISERFGKIQYIR